MPENTISTRLASGAPKAPKASYWRSSHETLPPLIPASISAPPAPPIVPILHPARPGPSSYSAACDARSSRIRGVRYKCTACLDHDICESCFRLSEPRFTSRMTSLFASLLRVDSLIMHDGTCARSRSWVFDTSEQRIHPSCPAFDI
ncbi:unnamed protein product [Rhizoctonia solani]|uniref:ZZ-type domain-containing protein n=1 Tax=Rhizoctonia solani TaxID=456999 RepID=A0A8H2WRY7_9AGAM|nr:unnamed protein product [Rhizoctonia solani]